ncbi:MAG TPA: cytochrome P450 [Acidimicrobiia bacterium]
MTVTTVDLADPFSYKSGPPHEFFTYLRNNEPVYWHPNDGEFAPGFWVCTKYRDVIAIERDVATYSSAVGGALLEEPGVGTDLMMINQDPPQHTRLRMLVARGFTPKVIASMEPSIHRAAVTIVDQVAKKGGADFVPSFAAELPLVVIAELMGVPHEDRHKVFEWSNRMLGRNDPVYGHGEEDATDAAMEIFAYAQSLADARKERPFDDIVTQLVTKELEGEKLSDIEFNVFFLLLAVAGNETTRNLMSGGMLALMENPEQRERLVDDLSLLPTAVDEMLRYVSPVQYFRRTTTADTELRGQAIKAGDKVTIWYGAGNRDEEIFDDAQAFDISRSPNEHIAFGGRGPHYCLGASLAKLEIKMMFEEVLTRVPDFELAGSVEHLHSTLINGITRMPVKFTPES